MSTYFNVWYNITIFGGINVNICIGYVCRTDDGKKRDVFVDGQKWGLFRTGVEVEDGWYLLKTQSIISDKMGSNRCIYENIGDKLDDETVSDIVNITFRNHEGIACIINKYERLIPLRTRTDTRFAVLKEIMRIDKDFSIKSVTENEMSIFIIKLCNIVKDRVIGDLVGKVAIKKDVSMDIE